MGRRKLSILNQRKDYKSLEVISKEIRKASRELHKGMQGSYFHQKKLRGRSKKEEIRRELDEWKI